MLDELGAPHRTVTTRSIEHAGDEAARAAEQGETVAAVGGDGLLRPLAGALRGEQGELALIPAGAATTWLGCSGSRRDVGEATRIAVEGEERLLDVAEAGRHVPYMGIASLGFDSDANRIANEAKLVRGNAVYLYAALRALAAWKPASFSVTVDGERHDVSGYSVAVGNSKAYGGGMYLLPQAELDDGQLDVLITKRCSKLTFLRSLPGSSRAPISTRPTWSSCEARRWRWRPTVPSWSTPTATRSPPRRRPCGWSAAACA